MNREAIASNVRQIGERIARAARRAGRDPATVRLVAAAKGMTAADVEAVLAAGVRDIGENHAQELRRKYEAIGDRAIWHYLGGLQTNKVRFLDVVRTIHSVDRAEECDALQRRGDLLDRTWDVLIEVNVAGETTKQGLPPRAVEAFLRSVESRPRVRPKGLMIMAPQAHRAEDVRWVFAEGRKLRDRLNRADLTELSMGMTEDFEVAIEEGSTIVRIGRAIFGERESADSGVDAGAVSVKSSSEVL